MRGNSFGDIFTVSTFGESHGTALGCLIDGIPAGLSVSLEDLQMELDRRRPGRLKVSTARDEKDQAKILSGVFENKTLGTPICVVVENTNQRSEDYKNLKDDYRPGHADQTTMDKFGFRDHRGGGRASGRETLARVIGGYFASLIIPQMNFQARIIELGPHKFDSSNRSPSRLGLIDGQFDDDVEKYLLELKEQGNSCGGKVLIEITGCPKGLGEPIFDKLKAVLSHGFMSIGSCMGVQYGLGNDFAHLTGKDISGDQNNFAGIEGGISNGEKIYAELVFKAPSTIGKKALEGRHDPCILPRVLPVVEAMAKITLADQALKQNAFQISQ